MNRCATCGLDFSSVRAFDTHHVGKHQYTHEEGVAMKPPRDDGRRCLTEDELRAAGFSHNARGRWGLTADMVRARQRFSARPRTSLSERGATSAFLTSNGIGPTLKPQPKTAGAPRERPPARLQGG
jgi:hypothetical protein